MNTMDFALFTCSKLSAAYIHKDSWRKKCLKWKFHSTIPMYESVSRTENSLTNLNHWDQNNMFWNVFNMNLISISKVERIQMREIWDEK